MLPAPKPQTARPSHAAYLRPPPIRVCLAATITWLAIFAHAVLSAPQPSSIPPWASFQPLGLPAYTTFTRRSADFKVYHNIRLHVWKWYAFLQSEQMDNQTLETGLSTNNGLFKSPVADIAQFTNNLKTAYLPGNTLLIDVLFPALAQDLGHWLEQMVPTYNVLSDPHWTGSVKGGSTHIDRVLMSNSRKTLSDWCKEILTLALQPAVEEPGKLPVIVDQDDLQNYDSLSWLEFENLIVIQDRYTHPQRKTGFIGADHGDLWRYDGCDRWVNPSWVPAFASQQVAQQFRLSAYQRVGWPPPQSLEPHQPLALPPTLLYVVHHEDVPQVSNSALLYDKLQHVANAHGLRARMMSLTSDAPFTSHLAAFAEAAVVVGRHGPLMANAVFMRPGSMLLELLPYKWEWHGLSQLIFNMTQSMGDIHHYAWRPLDASFCDYKEANDSRYAEWLPNECHARECLVVHARAGVTVQLDEVHRILDVKIPSVLKGDSVDSLHEPWPSAA